MKEQLTVEHFGPLLKVKVDFKRVTVFIGPTGGGKSTLAKLAAMFRDKSSFLFAKHLGNLTSSFGLATYSDDTSRIEWKAHQGRIIFTNGKWFVDYLDTVESEREKVMLLISEINKEAALLNSQLEAKADASTYEPIVASIKDKRDTMEQYVTKSLAPNRPHYLPAERLLLAVLGETWPDLIGARSSLPATLLSFAKDFLQARKEVESLDLPGVGVSYEFADDRDRIRLPNGRQVLLTEAASGVQSVAPLLVLLEYLSRSTDQAQSFIIEEPELNLYPTAQRELVNALVAKCTKGKNDLTITTHSPYVLSALNLALYADKVATLFPHQRAKVAKLIPEEYWLKADEFSAYHVAAGKARSIFDSATGLLSESQLDEVSGDFADLFDRLTDLRVPAKKASVKAAPRK